MKNLRYYIIDADNPKDVLKIGNHPIEFTLFEEAVNFCHVIKPHVDCLLRVVRKGD